MYNLGSDNIRNLVGIDDAGEVVVIERCPMVAQTLLDGAKLPDHHAE
jgi:hypothetical protein